jgi:hypothetical protein
MNCLLLNSEFTSVPADGVRHFRRVRLEVAAATAAAAAKIRWMLACFIAVFSLLQILRYCLLLCTCF